jgi:hypothetical protein
MMLRNGPQQAAITKIELMILKRKCDCKVTIFDGSASSSFLPSGIRIQTSDPKKTIHFFYVIINEVEVLLIYQWYPNFSMTFNCHLSGYCVDWLIGIYG